MKIGIGQINPTVGDMEGNVTRCLDAVRQAHGLGAGLVVLPELALPGCHPKDILLDPGFVEAVGEANAHLAVLTRDLPPVIVGTVLAAESRKNNTPQLYNAAVLLEGGRVRMLSAKQTLPMQDVFFEPRWFIPGHDPQAYLVAGMRLGVLVGGERESAASLPDADIVVCLAASPFVPCIEFKRQAFARAMHRSLVYANLVGGNDDLVYDGRSFAANRAGELVCQLAAFEQDVRVVDMAIPGDGVEDSSITALEADNEFDIPGAEELLMRALSLGIRDFARKNGLERVFIGLSGGVDSALVAVLAADALGAERVTCVAMPSRFTDPRSTQSAQELAQSLGTGFEVVPIEPLHAAAEAVMGKLLQEGTAAENVQARIRMVILMGYVNRYGGMLLNTGNKTEASLGYATLYGDTAGSLCPIGDLTKPQVVHLARWIHEGRGLIPDFVLDRKPTAELRPGQVDPFEYDQIAPVLEKMVLENRSNPAMQAAEHKRAQMGVVLKVSEKAFGPGRMVPITKK